MTCLLVFDTGFINIFLNVLFNNAASCYDNVAPVTIERVSMEHWWNDADKKN
jgi:hypothetical protein